MSGRAVSPLVRRSFSSALAGRNVQSLESVFGAKITLCGDIIGHRIRFRSLFAEALNTARERIEVRANGQLLVVPNNTRLAIYGDSVAQTHLCRKWLFLGPMTSSAAWTSVASTILSDDNFNDVYHKFAFHRCAHFNKVQQFMLTSRKIKAKATLVEAILGAVHIDGGDVALQIAMERLGLESHPDLEPRKQPDRSGENLYQKAKGVLGFKEPAMMDNYALADPVK